MKRFGFVFAAAVLLLASLNCYSTRERTPEGLVAVESYDGERIAGYTDAEGHYHKFEGYVRTAGDDSLAFLREERARGIVGHDINERRVLARKDVKMVHVLKVNAVGTFVAVVAIVALVAVVAMAAALAAKESCPFIYSYDGERYVFDGEPYGGATMKALERTDWSELEHLVAVDGAYRLRLTNEVPETQHTNRLTLLAVDHPPGTAVAMDKQGAAHAFRNFAPLVEARDENGEDLLVWLRDTDYAVWYPDLDRYAGRDSLIDTRNHIVLRFARPAGADRVWLVSNAATGLWGSHMIRSMLALRGDRLDEFYAAINGSSMFRQQLLDWNAREELFELFLEVRRGDRWVKQDFVPGGGPFVSETRAIPLDLAGVSGPDVEIRIHPPIGFWSLNSFRLAWGEDSVEVTRLEARSAKDQKGADVRRAIAEDDDRYLDFPTQQDRAELVFAAPPEVPGRKRTLIAETRGWYELHIGTPGPVDYAAIGRLTSETGYAVRHALREFAQYQRTGVLLGAPGR